MNSPFLLTLFNLEFTAAPYFMKAEQSSKQIVVFPLAKADIGNYSVILRVSETKAPSYYTEYRFNI